MNFILEQNSSQFYQIKRNMKNSRREFNLLLNAHLSVVSNVKEYKTTNTPLTFPLLILVYML